MKKISIFIVILLTFCTSAFSQTQKTGGQTNVEKYRIGITNHSFTPDASNKPNNNVVRAQTFDEKYFALVQFYNIPSDQQRKDLATKGMVLTDYLSGNAYYAVVNESFPFEIIKDALRAVIPIDKQLKTEANLYAKGIPPYAISSNGTAKMVIAYYATLPYSKVVAALESKGVIIEKHREYSRQIDVLFDASKLDEITALPFIQFIGVQDTSPVLEGEDHNNTTGRSNFVNTGFGGLNYNGDGVVIAVGEGGTIGTLIDVKGRLNELATGAVSSHKVGVLTYMAGAGNQDPTNRNNAWGSSILSVGDFPNYSTLYSSNNLRYTNHSYGFSIAGAYTLAARDHDLRIASLPNHLVIYSSGNSGTSTGYAPYAFANWANITGEVKQSKNQFAIGALFPNDSLTGFSSRGPMYDGRIIPQLAIEGAGGTSNAAPKITGIMAMLAQIYKDKTSGSEPTSSLLRAVLLNTADDLENSGPDYKTGYGRPNMRRAYNLINNSRYLTSSVSHGNTNTHNITVPAGAKQLRVMIVWPDVAAAVNANPAIVNNLNLVAKNPSLTSFNPWVLDHTASVASISATATRGVDSINTIEQVTVDNPSAGTWTADVNGFNVPVGPQTYYLTYEILMDELQIAFPLENQRFISGEFYHLRWDSYGGTGLFTLSYELNNSGTWTNIASGIDSSTRVYNWLAPSLSGGINTIKFRVQRGLISSTSNVNYIGEVPQNFRIFSVCTDTVVLKWSPIAGASSYKVYKLGTNYMEQVISGITFSGTTATLTGQSTTASEYYAVSVLTSSAEGSRTMTIEKVPGDFSCGGIYWTGATSTDWFNPANWSTASVPTATDNVIIPSAPTNQPSIAAAGAVCNRITIESGASLSMSGATAFTLSVAGDWINNGTFNRGIGTVDFNGTNDYQEISGTNTTNFNVLRVSKAALSRVLEVLSVITLNAATNPLDIASGTFKLSSASTITPFTNSTGADLTSNKGLWNNGGTFNSGNFNWSLNGGLIRLSAGTINVGTNSNNIINYLNNGKMTIEGGNLNIAGRFSPNSGVSSTTYTQTGGIITVNTIGSTSTTAAPFQINATGTCTITGGTIVIQRASSNAADYINLSTNSTISGGTLQIGNSATPASQTIRINSSVPVYNLVVSATNAPTAQLVTNGLTVKNDVTISGGTLNSNNLDMAVGGHWINNGSLVGGTSLFTFNGINTQNISGTSSSTVRKLTINNNAGLQLSGSVDLKIDELLTFQKGSIKTIANKVIFEDNALITGNDQTKFIDGNCRKIGDDAFTFPIGSGTVYAPISISAPASTTDHFTASYFATSPHPTYSTASKLAPVAFLSGTEYWILNRTGGTSNVSVTLSWNATRSGTVSSFGDLLVSRWDGTQWVSEGNSATTGTAASGSITSNTVTSFSPFTLGSSSTPLPLQLISFSAVPAIDKVLLKWVTASETNNDFFTVERSNDGKTWENLFQVKSLGNASSSQDYNEIDLNPYLGTSYYRLKQTQINGKSKYSNTAVVNFNKQKDISLAIYPNPASGILYLSTNTIEEYSIEIISTQGKTVLSAQNAQQVDISHLSNGHYTIRAIFKGNNVITQNLLIRK